MMWTVPDALALTEEQRRTLHGWVAARNTPQKVVFRARIVLLAAEGKANRKIAQELRTSRPSVILWRRRFREGGTAALTEDAPGRGRKATISAARVKQIVEATLHTKPAAATHWQNDRDVENLIRNDIDDFFFEELRGRRQLSIDPGILDTVVDDVLASARVRLAQ